MKNSTAVIVFTRYPKPGETKTRLIPVLGEGGAANFHTNLIIKTLGTVKNFTSADSSDLIISFSDSNYDEIQNLLGENLEYCQQRKGNLGQKFIECFHQVFESGYDRVITIGSDIPNIRPQHLKTASKKLVTHELVIGPASDGGYYLIGMTKSSFASYIFEDIDWGGSTVLRETLDRVKELEQNYYLLPELKDLDTPEDLKKLKNNDRRLYNLLTEGI